MIPKKLDPEQDSILHRVSCPAEVIRRRCHGQIRSFSSFHNPEIPVVSNLQYLRWLPVEGERECRTTVFQENHALLGAVRRCKLKLHGAKIFKTPTTRIIEIESKCQTGTEVWKRNWSSESVDSAFHGT